MVSARRYKVASPPIVAFLRRCVEHQRNEEWRYFGDDTLMLDGSSLAAQLDLAHARLPPTASRVSAMPIGQCSRTTLHKHARSTAKVHVDLAFPRNLLPGTPYNAIRSVRASSAVPDRSKLPPSHEALRVICVHESAHTVYALRKAFSADCEAARLTVIAGAMQTLYEA